MSAPDPNSGFSVTIPAMTGAPKAWPFNLDFTVQPSYSLDFTNAVRAGKFDPPQALFIDNSANTQSLSVQVENSAQIIVVPPNYQMFVPVLCSKYPKFTIFTTGSASCNVTFLNYQVPAILYPAKANIGSYNGSGYLNVSDVALDAVITGQNLGVLNSVTGDAGKVYPQWIGSQYYSGQITAVGPTDIIVPTAGLAWFATSIDIMVSPDAALAAAAELLVQVVDGHGGNVVAQGMGYLPAAAPATPLVAPSSLVRLSSISVNGKAAANALNITLNHALTVGKVIYNISGGITPVVG